MLENNGLKHAPIEHRRNSGILNSVPKFMKIKAGIINR